MANLVKKSLSILLIVTLLTLTVPINILTALSENTTEFLRGSGTAENPYLISSQNHLNNVRKYLGAHFQMTADIIFSPTDFEEGGAFYNDGQGWQPIGTDETQPFAGVFDGNGHTVSGLTCNPIGDGSVYAGLFGWNCGTISHLGMKDNTISATATHAYAGGVAGTNYATITDCYHTGTVFSNAVFSNETTTTMPTAYAGGITGENVASINKSYNIGTISATATFGDDTYIYPSSPDDHILPHINIGGITGHNKNIVDNCHNNGAISATVNYIYDEAIIHAGGIVGENYTTIKNCYNSGTISVTITSSFGNANLGGITGSGALKGTGWQGNIYNCYNTGTMSAVTTDSYAYIGGIVGLGSSTTINSCFNSGTISSASYTDIPTVAMVGGIAGFSGTIVINCCNIGAISCINDYYDSYAGGIVGKSDTPIIDCYNSGNIFANAILSDGHEVLYYYKTSYAGGIAGSTRDSVTNCYNLGNVSANAPEKYIGGIAGTSDDLITHCYYINTATSGIGNADTPDHSIRCTAEEMQKSETFAGFDFETVWEFAQDNVCLFPTLRSVPLSQPEDNTTDFAGGNGSFYYPYQIENKTHLNNARKYLGAHFQMTADIIFSPTDFEESGAFYNDGQGWQPIDTDETQPFAGVFDGNGHTVSGLICNLIGDGSVYAGLFGWNCGTISHLGMKDNTISATATHAYAGGVAGANYATITGCYHTGTVSTSTPSPSLSPDTDSNAFAGGIAGYNQYRISKCYNTGTIYSMAKTAYVYTGGIAGYNYDTIVNCYNTGSISSSDYAGGILGANYGVVKSCYYLDTSEQGVDNGFWDDSIRCTMNEMQRQETFAEFDFETVWTMEGNPEYLYPELRDVPALFTKKLERIAITASPSKTSYHEGEAFDASGLQITAYYNNGASEVITDYTLSGYTPTFGTKEITVNYKGKIATFTVTVVSKLVVSIAIKSTPAKTTYFVGEFLNLSGGKITVRYNNNTQTDMEITSEMVSGYNAEKPGTQIITVAYNGKTDTFTVTVKGRTPGNITSGKYHIGGGYISKIGAKTTAAQLLNSLNEKPYCKIYLGNKEVTGSMLIGTGMTVKLLDGNTVKQTVTIIVTGDTNGDGYITITDMLAVKSHLLTKSTLTGAAAKAADTNGDKAISITDFIQIKAHILEKNQIQPKAC